MDWGAKIDPFYLNLTISRNRESKTLLKKDIKKMLKINAGQAALSEFSDFTAQIFVSSFFKQVFFHWRSHR